MTHIENTGSISNLAHVQNILGNLNINQRPEIPPLRPSIVIPFRRDRDFVERPVFNEIWRRALEPAARVGVVGLGGVGKTQLAIEYAYRRREAEPQLWVLWVHASSAARFERSYRQIAQQMRISGWDDPKADIQRLVYGWLVDENHGPWTMVVDNADNTEAIFESCNGATDKVFMDTSSETAICNYLPICAHGSIVITSRSREVAEGLIEYTEDILDVAGMKEEDGDTAVTLLSRRLNMPLPAIHRDSMKRLVRELDYMPLAIAQAAAYINAFTPRMTVPKYLDQLLLNDTNRARLLQQNLRDPRRDGQASNSIIITWHTSFEHIRCIRMSAARLLALMSLFDHEGIPERLLHGQYDLSGQEEVRDIDSTSIYDKIPGQSGFEKDIAILRAYNLVEFGIDERLFDMHRLVQFSTRAWLEMYGELAQWQSRYINIMHAAFPTGEYEDWSICQELFPHVETMTLYSTETEDLLEKRARVLLQGAWYALRRGQYTAAYRLANIGLKEQETLFGKQSIKTMNGMNLLAMVLQSQGKYEQAEEIHRRALIGRERELGSYHSQTLTSVDNLALVLKDQGKYEEAEVMHRRALTGCEREFGDSDPITMRSVNNLAVVLRERGKYEQAEKMFRRALAGQRRELGDNHPNTLVMLNNLASVLQDQGKNKQAEKMFRQALAGQERELGVSHPSTLMSLNNLAAVLLTQGQYEQAEESCRRALAGQERELGGCHPVTLSTVSCLADILEAQGHYKSALSVYDRAVRGRVQVLGPSHPDTLQCQRTRRSLLRVMDIPYYDP